MLTFKSLLLFHQPNGVLRQIHNCYPNEKWGSALSLLTWLPPPPLFKKKKKPWVPFYPHWQRKMGGCRSTPNYSFPGAPGQHIIPNSGSSMLSTFSLRKKIALSTSFLTVYMMLTNSPAHQIHCTARWEYHFPPTSPVMKIPPCNSREVCSSPYPTIQSHTSLLDLYLRETSWLIKLPQWEFL